MPQHSLSGFCRTCKGLISLAAASSGQLLWPISAVLTLDLVLSAVLCCHCHTYGLITVVFLFVFGFFFFFTCIFLKLVCQFWEACQATCSTNAFSLGDKTEMTRQSPFCQHCHGSTGTTVYPKVNGMTECQTGRKVCLFHLKWVDRRHRCHVTHRCESTSQISDSYVNANLQSSIQPFIFC